VKLGLKKPMSYPRADQDDLHVAAGVILLLVLVLLVLVGGSYLANQIWSPEIDPTHYGFPAALCSAAR
jgi:hypothetical protein